MTLAVASISSTKAKARLPEMRERPGDTGRVHGDVVFIGRVETSLNHALAACVLDPGQSWMQMALGTPRVGQRGPRVVIRIVKV